METTRRSRGPKQYVRILLGVVAAVFAIKSFVETRSFVQHATRVQGVVRSVDRTDSIDGEGNVSSVPDIVFETSSGGEAMLRGDGNYVRIQHDYKVGEHVDVLYDQRAPADARVAEGVWLWTLTLGALGVLLLGGPALDALGIRLRLPGSSSSNCP